jgi:hypothetical protein
MRLIKLFGLVAIAAVAAMAVLGASSASATFHTSLCKSNEGGALTCAAANQVTHIKAESVGSTLLLTNIVTIHCNLSHLLAEALEGLSTLTGAGAINPQLVKVTELSLSECKTHAGMSCTFTFTSLGHLLVLKTAANLASVQSHGTSLKMVCGFVMSCTFGGLPTLHFSGAANDNSHAHLTANELELAREGGSLCPETATWDALYLVTLPLPLYIKS